MEKNSGGSDCAVPMAGLVSGRLAMALRFFERQRKGKNRRRTWWEEASTGSKTRPGNGASPHWDRGSRVGDIGPGDRDSVRGHV